MRGFALVSVLLVGCGRIAFDPLADAAGIESLRQRAYVKASNGDAGDTFGGRVALSDDGMLLAVGAPYEDSGIGGINSNSDDSQMDAGAVYMFARDASGWSQQAYIKARNPTAGDLFGGIVALSADGTTLAVGAAAEDGGVAGINGNEADESRPGSGAAYVFVRSGSTWTQQAYVKASVLGQGDTFGGGVALSADGSTLAVSAPYEGGGGTGTSPTNSGAISVFTRTGTTWSEQAVIKASNPELDDVLGESVALSADGSTLAAGARYEDSAATGIGGDQMNNAATDSGALYVFTRAGTTWSQQAYIKASNTGPGDDLGYFVALSGDGSTLAAGAFLEDSAATGVDGEGTNDAAMNAGAVFVFARTGTTWAQQAYVKASNTDALDRFGLSVRLSSDGSVLAVGANSEAGGATGVNGDQTDNTASGAGALYLYTRSGTTWTHTAYVKASNTDAGDGFGAASACSRDCSVLAVAAPFEASAARGIDGDQSDDSAYQTGAVYVFSQ